MRAVRPDGGPRLCDDPGELHQAPRHFAGSFLIFTGISMLAFLFNFKMVSETKKKTLGKISAFWT